MRILTAAPVLALLRPFAIALGLSMPGCVLHCWDNTKYVSKCLGTDTPCLCSEKRYQKLLHQCLFSQCDTVHFNAALDHATLRCSEAGVQIHFADLPTANGDELRRREQEYASGGRQFVSGSAGYPISSAFEFATESAHWPTKSVDPEFATQSAAIRWLTENLVTPVAAPPSQDTAVMPSKTASILTALDMALPAHSSTTIPELFLGTGIHHDTTIIFPLIITLSTLYITI